MIKLIYSSELPETTPFLIIPVVDISGENFRKKLMRLNLGSIDLILADFEESADHSLVFGGDENISRILIVKLKAELDLHLWRKFLLEICVKNSRFMKVGFSVDLSELEDTEAQKIEKLFTSLLLTISLATYKPVLQKSESQVLSFPILTVYSRAILDWKSICRKVEILNQVVVSGMDLINTPSNLKSISQIVARASSSSEKYAYDLEVLDFNKLKDLGFHALLAVNQGSTEKAQCIVAKYFCMHESAPTVAIIGKGVIFDTGGVSLKRSANMHYMKSDLSGAATALAVIEACSALRMKINLIVVAPLSDNSIGSSAIKPGDVINSYLGKTIEVIDTDAEGRLLLADGIAYANRNFLPGYIIDLATLTGSIVQSLGTMAAGLMSTNSELIEGIRNAGLDSGERIWPMPLWPELIESLESDVADIKNLSDLPYAGASTAGKFLEFFTEEHPAYAHIDIAGTAYHKTPFGKSYTASGFGILLMVNWLESLVNS